jgi:hypothetical protein
MMEIPSGVKMRPLSDGVRISWPPLPPYWLVLAGFLLFTAIILVGNLKDFGSVVLFLLVLAGFFYVTGLVFINRSVLHISWREMTISCGPLPYKSQRQFDPHEIRQVYVRLERVGRTTTYGVYALDRSGDHLRLWSVADGQVALYLEQEIERFLGIPDEVVRGEWRPDPYLWEA